MQDLGVPTIHMEGDTEEIKFADAIENEPFRITVMAPSENDVSSDYSILAARPAPRSPRPPMVKMNRSPRRDSVGSQNSSGSGGSQSSNKRRLLGGQISSGSCPPTRASSFREGGRPHIQKRSHRGNNHSSNNNNNNLSPKDSTDSLKDDRLGRRRSSMPNVTENLLTVPNADGADANNSRLRRVRSFKTTSKGVINRGDSFKKKSTHSLMSSGSANAEQRQAQQLLANQMAAANAAAGVTPELLAVPPVPTYYRVMMMGGEGTGKSQIAKQFMTSDFLAGTEESTSGERISLTSFVFLRDVRLIFRFQIFVPFGTNLDLTLRKIAI